jgi:hypothetical protein
MDLTGRLWRNAMSAVVVLLLLFPCSSSVLCIAPDHVAIEDLNAACCECSDMCFRADNPLDNGFDAAGSCKNCIDILMMPNTQGAVLNSSAHAALNLLSNAIAEHFIPPDVSFPAYRSSICNKMAALVPVYTSLPLRC